MADHTDPNQVRLTGENQYMRLHTEANGPMTTRGSHWRILLSPSGPGHVLFLRSDVTDGEQTYLCGQHRHGALAAARNPLRWRVL